MSINFPCRFCGAKQIVVNNVVTCPVCTKNFLNRPVIEDVKEIDNEPPKDIRRSDIE